MTQEDREEVKVLIQEHINETGTQLDDELATDSDVDDIFSD